MSEDLPEDLAARVEEALRVMAEHPERVVATANGRPILDDWNAVVHASNWLMVLAAPQTFRSMQRVPSREHLLAQVETFAAYVAHDGRYHEADYPPPFELRAPLVARLRPLIAQWTGPDLPEELVQTVRELLHAEGRSPPPGGWDADTLDPRCPFPVEDVLMWPEGVPAVLKAQAAGMKKDYIDLSGQR